jgi:hypothetical protein
VDSWPEYQRVDRHYHTSLSPHHLLERLHSSSSHCSGFGSVAITSCQTLILHIDYHTDMSVRFILKRQTIDTKTIRHLG